jgi:hypothetical protein
LQFRADAITVMFMSDVMLCPMFKQKEKCDDLMSDRHSRQLQEMSGILGVPPKNCHRRLHEAKERANQAASGQRREVAD